MMLCDACVMLCMRLLLKECYLLPCIQIYNWSGISEFFSKARGRVSMVGVREGSVAVEG